MTGTTEGIDLIDGFACPTDPDLANQCEGCS